MLSNPKIGNTRFVSLWPTNVLVRQLDFAESVNGELAQAAKTFYQEQVANSARFPYRGSTVSLFNTVRSPALDQLFSSIEESFKMYVAKFYPTVEWEQMHVIYNSFVNYQNKQTKWVIPHSHLGNQLVATYYPEVRVGATENADTQPGAMCFHDPRPVHANWMVRQENKIYTVQQKPGTLVIFPGFTDHSTFPFFDESSEKVAIVTNLRFFPKSDANLDRYYTAEETKQFQSE